ncbi:MAG TPA: hypothetical protein VFP55_06050 [Solirubrobacteraceae bacterium]|nr:hypothetical protein [Solirubrobacteraceae bacterium]
MRRRIVQVKLALATLLALALGLAPSALAAKPITGARGSHGGGGGGGSTTAGYDISYPQCSAAYPASPAFGIVGVNGGLANDANPCLGSELKWALDSAGLSNQPNASLYINTADPGPAPGVTDWPGSGSSPYGTCGGGWTEACSYVYGQQRAAYSYGVASGVNASVAAANPWWLDIETSNSWATSTTSQYTQLNIAAIRGFIDGLTGAGATGPVGIYSTAAQWNAITGLTAQTTASGLVLSTPPPDWVAGPRASPRTAQSNCSSGGFTGASPTLAQYSSGGYDADLRCG